MYDVPSPCNVGDGDNLFEPTFYLNGCSDHTVVSELFPRELACLIPYVGRPLVNKVQID
jgi:hypothetical protein